MTIEQLERVRCPYCGADDPCPWATENGYQAVRCARCDFVYVSPRPPRASIDSAAETGLHRSARGVLDVVGRFSRTRVKGLRERLLDLFPGGELRARPLRWLDVGAGFGELLLALRELADPRSTIEGIEPCRPKLERGRRLGLAMSDRDLGRLDRPYDHVSLIDVFSHLPDPPRFIAELGRHLQPGGEILLATGNGAEISADAYVGNLDLPDHLVFAGERHLRGLLERAGFELIRLGRYPPFLPEPAALTMAKNLVKLARGRPPMPIRYDGPFRSLWVRARWPG